MKAHPQRYLWGAADEDYAKFLHDKSGRGKVPAPGTESTPENKRYWMGMNHILHTSLASSRDTNALAIVFQREFNKVLEEIPTTEWTSTMVYSFLKKYMAESATRTLMGPRVTQLTPEFLELLWEFDRIAASLVWGLPKWMNRSAYKARDDFHAAVARYLYPAVNTFDWNGPDAAADWEPVFGSRANREVVRWMKEDGFAPQTIAGAISVLFAFG